VRRRSRASSFLLGGIIIVIAGALAVYAVLLWGWLKPRGRGQDGSASAGSGAQGSRALEEARKAFRGRYLDPASHMRLADELHKAGRIEDAFYVMSAARSFFGDEVFHRSHSHVITHRGRHFLEGAAFDASPANEARLRDRLAAAPGDPNLHLYLASIAASRGDVQGSIKLVDAGLSAKPGDQPLLLYGAELFGRTIGDLSSAVPWYGRTAAAGPDTHEGRLALNELGRIAGMSLSGRDAGAPAAARQSLKEVAVLHPDSPAAFSTMALAALAAGETDSVRALVLETVERDPSHAGALAVIGALALVDRAPDEAVKALSAAWRRNPRDLYSAQKLSQLCIKHRADPEAALPFLVAVYMQRPDWVDGEPIETLIGRILEGRKEGALANVRPTLLGKYFKSDDASLRAGACEQAAAGLDPRWVDVLGRLLDDDTELVRRSADFALFSLAADFKPALLNRRAGWLGSTSPFIRARALNLFADLDPENTFPQAVTALSDPSPTVRFLAKTMVLDHYYKETPGAEAAAKEYLSRETDPAVLAYYARLAPRKGAR
jgi:tetratricopeptide (TPR) repeat protein